MKKRLLQLQKNLEATVGMIALIIRKMLDLQHQYNNCTTTPHMTVRVPYTGVHSHVRGCAVVVIV
jgi:hypothetical protein